MKYKRIYVLALGFFLAKHTQLYYENYLGKWEGYLSSFFLLYFFALIIILLYHSLLIVFKDFFQNQQRHLLAVVLFFVILITIFSPNSLFMFRGRTLLKVGREGVASCHTYLMFQDNNLVYERGMCFGERVSMGTYTFKGDTLQIKNIRLTYCKNDTAMIGVIKPSKYNSKLDVLNLYCNTQDTTATEWAIIINKLKN